MTHSEGRYSANKHFVQSHEVVDRVNANTNAQSDAVQDGDEDENLISEVMHIALQAFDEDTNPDEQIEEDEDEEQILWNPK
jgi:hypothetical protein